MDECATKMKVAGKPEVGQGLEEEEKEDIDSLV